MMHDYKFMQNILYQKNMTNNVRYIIYLFKKQAREMVLCLHLRSYNAWESGKMWTKTITIKTDMCMIGWNTFGITYRFKMM